MVQKRHRERVDEIGVQHQETNPTLGLCCGRELFKIKDHSFWENFLRKIVRDVVERAFLLELTCNYSINEAGTSRSRDLQLHFSNRLENDIFTLKKIRAQDGKPVQVVLRDANSGYAIVQSGPLSSAKVDILVINGDFCSGKHEDWNEEEFLNSVLCPRDGKRPLIIGTLPITLKDGIGFIHDLYFTDNSKWIPCRKFRLGAKIRENVFVMRVKEAISEPFRVKDNRGEGYRKHYPPHLEDELFRLEGISKDGKIYSRLHSNNIRTVKDFLQKIETDPSSLRRIVNRISDGDWKRLVEHARKCVMDNKLYAYCGLSILFNSAYQVVLANFDGQTFMSMDDLDVNQQSVVNCLRQLAYKELGSLVQVDTQSALNLRPLSHLLDMQCSAPSVRFQNLDLAVTLQSCDSSIFAGTQDQPAVHGLASHNFGSTSYNVESNLVTGSQYSGFPHYEELIGTSSLLPDINPLEQLGQ